MFHRVAVVSVFALACAACAGASKDLRPIVVKQAAFDLGCAPEKLTLAELGDASTGNMAGSVTSKRFGVEGCGRRASYQASCVKPMMMAETCNAVQTSAPLPAPSKP